MVARWRNRRNPTDARGGDSTKANLVIDTLVFDESQITYPILKSATLKIRGGCEIDRHGKRAGKGPLVQTELSGTIGVAQDQTLFAWYERTNLIFNDQGGGVPVMDDKKVLTFDKEMYNCGEKMKGESQARYDTIAPTVRADTHPSGCCQSVARSLSPPEKDSSATVYTIGHDERSAKMTDDEITDPLAASDYKDPIKCLKGRSVVRRLTPLECERLQGFPSEKYWDVSKMTKDEYIAWNLAEGNIIADPISGKVYTMRGPGGTKLDNPRELSGTELNGYRVVSIRNGQTKLQCRVHRIVWISQHGIIPDGYVIDHINNDKQDNRLSNLQLLTPEENSHKAKADGLYLTGLDNKATKLDPDLKDEIAFLYNHSDMTQRDLADLYGISKSRINQIIKEIGWTDIGEWYDSKGKKHKEADSPRYKALGNSIAIPFWEWMAGRICAMYDRPVLLGSLFDGIGGFPLAFSRHGAIPVWASEIEEFPIAVTKKHFPEEDNE